MPEKEFIVSHAHARAPITMKGKNLKEALASEGLDPEIWKEVETPEPTGDTEPPKPPE